MPRWLDLFLHLDRHLNHLAAAWGPWFYVAVGASIFAETGLVVAPYLPGETLVFSGAALAARADSPVNVFVLVAVGFVCTVLGDWSNFGIARRFGARLSRRPSRRLFTPRQVEAAESFFKSHGAKTVLFGRFFPLVRTVVPFLAGVGRMPFPQMAPYSALGGFAWATAFGALGYGLGRVPAVRERFDLVLGALVILIAIPALLEWRHTRRAASNPPPTANVEKTEERSHESQEQAAAARPR